MYDPTVGRWLSEDPEGFAAGDANLYRYAGNKPTTEADPSGLQAGMPGPHLVGGFPELRQTTFPISGAYPARIAMFSNNATPAERETIRLAFYNAAEQIRRALFMVDDNWAETTRLYRFSTVPGPDGPIQLESRTWRNINQNRQLLISRLRQVYDALRSPSTEIRFGNRPSEIHPDRNSMYTQSINLGICEIGGQIRARSHYWQLAATGTNSQAYWTIHELARLFLRLNNDAAYSNGQGVQRWDRDIEWLADRYNQWNWEGAGAGGDW